MRGGVGAVATAIGGASVGVQIVDDLDDLDARPIEGRSISH